MILQRSNDCVLKMIETAGGLYTFEHSGEDEGLQCSNALPQEGQEGGQETEG